MVYNAGYVPEVVYNLLSDNGMIFCHSARLLSNLAAEMPNEFTDVSTLIHANLSNSVQYIVTLGAVPLLTARLGISVSLKILFS